MKAAVATVKRERVKEEEYDIPQNLLDAMMEDIAACDALVKKRQDARPAGDGQITLKGIIKGYKTKSYDPVTKRDFNVQVPTPPEYRTINGTKDGKATTFPAKIVAYTQVMDLSEVPDVCELLEDGSGWRVKVKLSYDKKAQAWLDKHFTDFYDGKLKTSVPVDTFIAPDGTAATHKWVKIHHKSVIQVKISDLEGNIFRKINNQGKYEVAPFTRICFNGCAPEQYVGMRKDNDNNSNAEPAAAAAEADGEGGVAEGAQSGGGGEDVPQGYLSFDLKGIAILADDHDANMPPTEVLHNSINLDVHNLIPFDDLRAGKHCEEAVEFYASNKYMSKMGTENGVSIFKMEVAELSDFYRVFDGKERASYSIRLNVLQWHKTPEFFDKYSVKIQSTKKQTDLWRAMGILDPKTFGYIAHANTDIACWVEAKLWKSAVLKADSNNKPEENPLLKNIKCHYTFGFNTLIFDFLRYFPRRGLQISTERVLKEFDAWTGTNKRTGATTMNLQVTRDPHIKNPLHYAELMSPVLSLGNNAVENPDAKVLKPLNHGYSGDVWPIVEDCDFYVLTSHKLTNEERILYCGDAATTTLDEHDKFFQHLIDNEQVLYWIYAVRRDVVERYCGNTKRAAAAEGAAKAAIVVAPPTKKTAPAPQEEEKPVSATKKKPAKKVAPPPPVEEEDVEEESSAVPMEVEEEKEPSPIKKKTVVTKSTKKK